MTQPVHADYLVLGAGATGMAFVDALIDNADVSVALLDRRHSAGGHWLDAYPFVRLHQASEFYGVASTPLGTGALQADGPEAGLHERATAPEIVAYYARVLNRMVASGKVTFYPGSEYLGERKFSSRLSGQRFGVPDACRVVDARYLSPDIPVRTPAPFGGRRRRSRYLGQRSCRVVGCAPPVRDRGLRQNGHRCHRLADRERHRPRRDLLGSPA